MKRLIAMQLKHAWCSASPVLRIVYPSEATTAISGRAKRQSHTQPNDQDTPESQSLTQEEPQEEPRRQPRVLPQEQAKEQPNDHSQPQDQPSSQNDHDARVHLLTHRHSQLGTFPSVQPRWRLTPDGKCLERRFAFRSFQKATVPTFNSYRVVRVHFNHPTETRVSGTPYWQPVFSNLQCHTF